MWNVVTCENKALNPMLQSYFPYKDGPNSRENSWGLAQWNLDAHPEFKREQVQNPDFALNEMAKSFNKGDYWKWTCYTKIYGKT